MRYYVEFLDKNKKRITCGNDGSFIEEFPLVRVRKYVDMYLAVNPLRDEIHYANVNVFSFSDTKPIITLKLK